MLNDNEVKKALECCQKVLPNCNECPVEEKERIMCCDLVKGKALDLINRLQEENDTLKNVIKNSFLEKAGLDIDPLAEIKAEAYKEFAERLKAKADDKLPYDNSVDVVDIDNLLKEMAGENDA